MIFSVSRVVAVTVLYFVASVQARPSMWQNEDLSTKQQGGTFGRMGVSNFESGSPGSKCKIDHATIPNGGFVVGQTYEITAIASESRGLILQAGSGTGAPKKWSTDRETSLKMDWTASGSSVSFYLVCAGNGATSYVADSSSASRDPNGSTPSPTGTTPSPTPAKTASDDDADSSGGATVVLSSWLALFFMCYVF